jgi:hypothetical protein
MWTIVLVSSVLAGQPGKAGLPAEQPLELTVRRLVRQLDAARLAEREQAEQALLDLGTEVLDLLPPTSDHLPAEVQQRVGRIRQKFEQQMAEAATQPARVTLVGRQPLSQVLAKIQEQTGNRMVIQPGAVGGPAADPEVNVEFDKTPYWQAIAEVARQAGLAVYPYGEKDAISLVGQPEAEAVRPSLVSYSGPVRFEAIRVLAQRDLRKRDGGSLRLTLETAWEPRLSPISLRQPRDAIEAVDENGQQIRVEQREAKIEVPVSPLATAVELVIPFELPPREVKKIAKLTGVLDALLPGRTETFRFDRLATAKDVEKRVAGVTVKLEQVRKNNTIWQVRIRVRYDEPAGAMASHRTWMFDNEAFLEGPEGKKIEYDAFETTWQSENEFGIAYLFALEEPLDKYTFVYKTPSRILSSQFRYEISEVELP